jgi:coproporphyrinogen III oxidase-like Fe-S oxidoreductase
MDQIAQTAIRENVARGWLDDDHAGIRLTREGLFMADRVAADFL